MSNAANKRTRKTEYFEVSSRWGNLRVMKLGSTRKLLANVIKDEAGEFLQICADKVDLHPDMETWQSSFENLLFLVSTKRNSPGETLTHPHGLDIWADNRKVLSIWWNDAGESELISFRRGSWEHQVSRAVTVTRQKLRTYRKYLADRAYVLGDSL
jgi:hypothetical protein